MPFSRKLSTVEEGLVHPTRAGRTRRPIHVVHVVMALGVGGLERVVIELARRTNQVRYRTTIVCIYNRGSLADYVESLGISVVSLECNGRGLRTALLRLVRIFQQLRPDVVHTHNPNPHLLGSIAAAVLRLPVVVNT